MQLRLDDRIITTTFPLSTRTSFRFVLRIESSSCFESHKGTSVVEFAPTACALEGESSFTIAATIATAATPPTRSKTDQVATRRIVVRLPGGS